ncbi:hypothetical protein FM076_14610 [Streptomyces albus subsp. chlorinus]|uniref:hypothetical protein n=1 Tax=Streptomyces albus TaxID=1888 RepID=UPI00156FB602|nr:hypothetical protein [Streptomyces albus]NSC22350.1 hypothetical protein [Streptomyces albus subsp. chlorinus]
MRIDRFQEFAVAAYREAPEVLSAQPWSDGVRRPYGIEVQLAGGKTLRHAITRVRVPDEDLEKPEEPVLGEPPAPIEPRPTPTGGRDRQTAQYFAAVLAGTGNKEVARVYAYDQTSQNPGLGAEFHDGSKIHMLLV